MKTKLLSLFMIAAVAKAHAGTTVHETTNEFSASGDFNGDGNSDVLVIDKATGLYRIGYGSGTGTFAFANGRASGVTGVTGVAVGKLNGIAADSFAVTSPAQNRANILSPTTSGYTEPKAVFDGGLGPVVMAALDITGGAAPTAEDDLGIIASLDLVNQYEVRQIRSNAGAWSHLRSDNIPDFTVAHGNPIVPHAGASAIFAHMSDNGATNSFHAYNLTGFSANDVLSTAGLADGSQFICGIFDGPNADVIFWVPGQSSIILRRVVAAAPWAFTSASTATFGSPIAQLVPVNGPSGLRVLVRFTDGTIALYAYTLAGGFSAAAPITPTGATGVLSGVVQMAGNAFQLLYAATPGGPTNSMVSFGNTGSGWNQTGITALPALKPLSIYSNIMLLDDGLFRRDNVDLIRTYQFGDWGTAATVGGGGPFTILAASGNYGGATQGIGSPSTQTVGSVSSAPGGTAVNQMHPQFSIFNFNANIGPQIDEVTIAPTPGTYANAQQISFSGLLGGTTVYLRMNGSGTFQAWNPASPPWITRQTTVEYYASRVTGASPTRSANYIFNKPAALQDADGDGAPDFVEIAYGMDPKGGSDSDADGFSDADELAAGTNPNDALSKPASLPPSLDSMLVDVRLRLLNVAGATTAHGKPGACTVTVEDAFGNALGSEVIGTGGAAANFARVNTVGVDAAMGFLIVRSSTHFTADPAHLGFEPTGRELIGLVPALEPESWSWGINNGGIGIATVWDWGGVNWIAGSSNWNGGLGDMPGADSNWSTRLLNPLWDSSPTGTYSAAGWVSEYQAAINRGAQPYAEITLSPHTSLEAVLVGKIVGDLLTQRNPAPPIDGTGYKLSDVLISSFQGLRRTDPAHPMASVVRLNAVHRHVSDQLAAANAGANALRKLARDVYAQHNALPLDNLDALRSWLGQPLFTRSTPNPPGLSLVQTNLGVPQLLLTDQLTTVALPSIAEAPAGTQLQVTYYTDLPQIAGYPALEIISLLLPWLPDVVDEDSDHDLLADNWELRHFGTLAHNGFANLDGSAYSLAKEYLEGTDPRCNTISPTVGPIALQFNYFDIISAPPMQVRANWPERYASNVNVLLETSEDLTTWDTLTPLPTTDAGSGWFLRNVPADRPRRFFRPVAELKR
ncbi:MAG: hypothetical protein NTV80_27125 [Verrucomicrobia bacterium]|nr:hypothetical protein [Verrucomicrobiota bacterium]